MVVMEILPDEVMEYWSIGKLGNWETRKLENWETGLLNLGLIP
jgi:hypothetical protein